MLPQEQMLSVAKKLIAKLLIQAINQMTAEKETSKTDVFRWETYFKDRFIVRPFCGKSYLNGRTIYTERRLRYTAEISASWHSR